MHIVALVRWWYGEGWLDQVSVVGHYLRQVSNFFSISLLFRNLFQPFRQISVGRVRGSLDIQLRAWFDRLLSRIIGAVVRLTIIIAGSVWWCVSVVCAGVWLLLWGLLPCVPVVGAVASFGVFR